MKIVVINQYTENRGDEAAGTALIQNLLKNKCIEKIDIIYNSAYKLDFENSRVSHRHVDLRLKNIGKLGILKYLFLRNTLFDSICFANDTMKEMSNVIKEADYIYVTPCGASIGIYKDWAFLIRLLFVIKEKKTPIFCLNTIGSSGNILFDFLAYKVLKKSKLYVREQKSKDYLEKIGLSSELGVDTAFSLMPIHAKRDMNRIGLVITLLGWHPEYQGRNMSEEVLKYLVPSIACFCKERGYSIEIIPHIGSQEEFDYIFKVKGTLINNGLDVNNIVIRDDVKTAEEYDRAISQLRLMIGMRYHSIVLAAKNSIPYVALAYENKMKEVCHYTKCEDCYIDLQDDLSKVELFNYLKFVDDNEEQIKNKLMKVYEEELVHLSRLPLKELI
ncbi:TPA: polysaccharide pyruvyl transferase family protein [Streptococcus suis]